MLTVNTLDLARLAEHTQQFLTGWFADFAWHGTNPAEHLARVEAAITSPGNSAPSVVTLWTNSTVTAPAQRNLPPLDMAVFDEMTGDEFDERWTDLLDSYDLTGTWLHPDTNWEIDPLAWATNRSALYVGTLDRDDPTAPRRYDAARSTMSNDLGVVCFPLRAQWRGPELLGRGVTATDATKYLVLLALTEAGVHESLEMHQAVPGVPVIDPHNTDMTVLLSVVFADGTVLDGTAH